MARHSGPVLAMFRRDRRGQGAEDAFRAFGFAIDDASCATVESRSGRRSRLFCAG